MTCDWGDCEQIAIGYRWDEFTREWLPVCHAHWDEATSGKDVKPWEEIEGAGRAPREGDHRHRFDVVIRDDAHMKLLGCSNSPCEEVYQWDW